MGKEFSSQETVVSREQPAAPCAPYGGAPCSDFSFMRGCAGLKLSEACARGVSGTMARGWSTRQSPPRVAVPSGLFLGNRRTCGNRLESVFCCFDVRSPAYSFFPNAPVQRRAAQRTVRCNRLLSVPSVIIEPLHDGVESSQPFDSSESNYLQCRPCLLSSKSFRASQARRRSGE